MGDGWPQLSRRHGPTHGVFASKGRCSATAAAGKGIGQCERVWNSLITPFVRRQFISSFDCIRQMFCVAALHLSKIGDSGVYMHSPKMEKEKGVGGSDIGQTSKGGGVVVAGCHRRCDDQLELGSHRPVSVHAAVPHEELEKRKTRRRREK